MAWSICNLFYGGQERVWYVEHQYKALPSIQYSTAPLLCCGCVLFFPDR